MKMVTKTYQVIDFSVTQAMAELEYRLVYRDDKSTLITNGVLPCVQLARDGVQLPAQLLEARSRQVLHQTVADGLAQQLNRRLQEDVARKIVKGAQLKRQGNGIVINTAFKNPSPNRSAVAIYISIGNPRARVSFSIGGWRIESPGSWRDCCRLSTNDGTTQRIEPKCPSNDRQHSIEMNLAISFQGQHSDHYASRKTRPTIEIQPINGVGNPSPANYQRKKGFTTGSCKPF